jgi:hypothetical protein
VQVCGGVRRAVVLVVGALALCAAAVQPAGASLDSCPTAPLSHPFLPWLDLGSYSLAPNGGLEDGAAGWSLAGGAGVVRGNESYSVGSSTDSSSLALPNGSSATTSATCIGLLDPTLRFFAVNKGSLLSTLKVEALYTDAGGNPRAQTIGLILGTGGWQPTLPTLILANLSAPPLVTNGQLRVAFRFTPQGALGAWQIDDVYIDPLKGS